MDSATTTKPARHHTCSLPVYVDVSVAAKHPEVVCESRPWLDICHGQQGSTFLYIMHIPHRSPSRWTHAHNKRPFQIFCRTRYGLGDKVASSATLTGALRIAADLARDMA